MIAAAVVAGGAGGGWWLALPIAWVPFALLVPWFFRDPNRPGPRAEHLILAPADGRVVDVTEVEEPDFLHERARRVSIFMSVFDVHVNRHPVSGAVQYRHHRPGKFLNASLDKASVDNEQMSIGVKSPRGPVLTRQIAGLIARRIVSDPRPGDVVRQGERLGIIRFGSRVDTFLPLHARVLVKRGDRTRAGTTVLGEWSS